jgi:hypothetical protein
MFLNYILDFYVSGRCLWTAVLEENISETSGNSVIPTVICHHQNILELVSWTAGTQFVPPSFRKLERVHWLEAAIPDGDIWGGASVLFRQKSRKI